MWKKLNLRLKRINRGAYPKHLLTECKSALCLFGAGFYGASDGIHMYDADISHVTIVDHDVTKIHDMEAIYPKHWLFDAFDVFEWVEHTVELNLPKWDIVSIDPPTPHIPRCVDQLDVFVSLAKKYVTLTTYNEYLHKLETNYNVIDVIDRSKVALTSVVALDVERQF